jgi:hypothetical protein
VRTLKAADIDVKLTAEIEVLKVGRSGRRMQVKMPDGEIKWVRAGDMITITLGQQLKL